MKIVITGVSGLIGRTTAGLLAGAGHEVVGLSRSVPVELPRGVRHAAVDVRDASALARELDGADTVLHSAFMLDSREGDAAMEAVNVGGTQSVLDTAATVGAQRVVFMSSATIYGVRHAPDQPPSPESLVPTPHAQHPYAQQKLTCEALLAPSPLETLAVRASIILGRGTDNRLQEAMAMSRHVAARGPSYPWQLMHHDDVARFLALAVMPGMPTGLVNVAGDGAIDQADLAAILGRKAFKAPGGLLRGAAKVAGGLMGISPGEADTAIRMPLLDTTRMKTEFGFEPAWNAHEIAEDTILAVDGVAKKGGSIRALRGRAPYRHQILPAEAPAADGAPITTLQSEHAGEFDTPLDPRFPVYSQTNLAEALPGPSSPLTIDLMARALRGTTSAVADMLNLPDVLHREVSARLQGVFGHRFFINASGTYQVGMVMPGSNPDDLIDQYAGRHSNEMPGGKEAVVGTFVPAPESKLAAARRVSAVGLNVVTAMRAATSEVERVERQVTRLEKLTQDLDSVSEARLHGLILLARDLTAYAWTLQGLVNLVGGAAVTMATKNADSSAIGDGDELASSAALRGVRALAAEVAAKPSVAALLDEGGPGLTERLAREEPEFWQHVHDALDSFGHRGPGECELESRSFSDDVDGFLRTVRRASRSVRESQSHAPTSKPSAAVRRAQKMLQLRERNRDRCVRLTWLTRRIVLEQGRRLVAAERLDRPEDVFYLTVDALLDPPSDAPDVVARRRADRDRFREMHMPPIFNAEWTVGQAGDRLAVGETLQGIGISAGTVTGKVRIVDPDSVDDFEDDEILVAHVTDVGYTPLFALARAVVTDIGGEMSHAAVVAREFGVPCIVDTQVAAARLQNGDLVEVDGKAGTVTLIEHVAATSEKVEAS